MPLRLDRVRVATVVLFGLCAVLGCLAIWEVLSIRNSAQADGDAVAASDPRDLPDPPLVRAQLPSPQMSAAMVDRPLFTATRRPPPRSEKAAPSPPVPRPDLALVGTIVTGKERYGLLLDRKKNEFMRVARGSKVRGWEVREINNNEVIVSQRKQSHTYTLPRF